MSFDSSMHSSMLMSVSGLHKSDFVYGNKHFFGAGSVHLQAGGVHHSMLARMQLVHVNTGLAILI